MSSDERTAANDARRRTQAPSDSAREQYRLEPHESELRSGFDLTGFNRLADQLEDEETLPHMCGGRSADAAIVVAATDHVSRYDKQGRISAMAAEVVERHKDLLGRLAR